MTEIRVRAQIHLGELGPGAVTTVDSEAPQIQTYLRLGYLVPLEVVVPEEAPQPPVEESPAPIEELAHDTTAG